MTKTALLMVSLGCSSLPVLAHAGTFEVRHDPSGAPMCFTAAGEKAPLVSCQTFVARTDPSGAPMCFNDAGGKAPLARCAGPATFLTRFDPSGSPMCFDGAGAKAPLARCGNPLALPQGPVEAATQLAILWE